MAGVLNKAFLKNPRFCNVLPLSFSFRKRLHQAFSPAGYAPELPKFSGNPEKKAASEYFEAAQ